MEMILNGGKKNSRLTLKIVARDYKIDFEGISLYKKINTKAARRPSKDGLRSSWMKYHVLFVKVLV
jgi:hypothetical protein